MMERFSTTRISSDLRRSRGWCAAQWPGHAHFINPKADLGGHGGRDAHILERLRDVQKRLAGSDNAESRTGAVDDDAVEAIDQANSRAA